MKLLSDQLTNISKFYKINSRLLCFTNNGKLKSFEPDALTEQWTQQVNTQTFVGKFRQDLLFTYWQYRNVIFLNTVSGEIISNTELPFRPLAPVNGHLYGSFLEKNEQGNIFSLQYVKQDFSINVALVTNDFAPVWVDADICICQKGFDLFKCYSMEHSEELWRMNLNDLVIGGNAKLFGNIIHCNDLLYLSVHKTNRSEIISIDKFSGKLLNRTDKAGGEMYLADNKIYTSGLSSVTFIALENFEIKHVDLSSCLKEAKMNMPVNNNGKAYHDGKFYFASADKESSIGIIDLDTQTLLWKYTIPKTGSNDDWTKEILMDSNRLYVLTVSGKLYVFENS